MVCVKDHYIDCFQRFTEILLAVLYWALNHHNVYLEGTVLKLYLRLLLESFLTRQLLLMKSLKLQWLFFYTIFLAVPGNYLIPINSEIVLQQFYQINIQNSVVCLTSGRKINTNNGFKNKHHTLLNFKNSIQMIQYVKYWSGNRSNMWNH